MNKVDFGNIIKTGLQKGEKIYLPRIGTLQIIDIPARFVSEGKTVLPPSKQLEFNNKELYSSDYLARIIAIDSSISFSEAKAQVDQIVDSLLNDIKSSKMGEIPQVGVIRFDNDEFSFLADPRLIVDDENYGLEEIDLERMYNEEDDTTDIAISSISAGENNAGVADRKSEIVEIEPKIADKKVEIVDKNNEVADKEVEIVSSANETAVEDNSKNKTEAQIVEKEQNVLTDSLKDDKSKGESLKTNNDNKTDLKENNKKLPLAAKLLIWSIAIIVAIIGIILLIYLFRDTLAPILQKILYSKEELEIINYQI